MNDVLNYIGKLGNPQKEVCLELRKIILETFRTIKEGMKWGVPAYEDGLFYFVALKDHVNLGFSIQHLTAEEAKLFDGGGKTTRKIEIKKVDEINPERIINLLKLVKARN